MRFAIAFLMLAGLHSQPMRDPAQLVGAIRAKLRPMTQRLANYACIETIDRNYYRNQDEPASCKAATATKLQSTDRIRLEVTVSQGSELHSWPGATRFDTRSLDEIVTGGGPISAGAFATYLLDVFDNSGVTFHFTGESPAALEFSFHVPIEASHYHVKVGTAWHATEYDGEFWVDPQSLELQRLSIRTEALPEATSMCETATALEYHRVHIGDGDILLPSRGTLHIWMRNGRQDTNAIAFSDCREYQAESQLRFDAEGDGAATARLPVRSPLATTIGLPIVLALESAVDTDSAAAGDPISAKVVKPVSRAGYANPVIPAGATVRGRITRVEHHLLPTPFFLVSISFNRLELTGISSPFAARLDRDDELAKQLGANVAPRGRGLESWDVGNFVFVTGKKRYVMPAGYESQWFTLATPPR